jgi:hypothetical protein
MSQRYVVIDAEGAAVNTIVWDGEADWTPPEGHTVALEDSDEGRAALEVATDRAIAAEQETD